MASVTTRVQSQEFANLGDFLSSVVWVPSDPRLAAYSTALRAAVGSDEHSGSSDPYGGFAVPRYLVEQMLGAPSDSDPVAARPLSIEMRGPQVDVPARIDKNHTTSVSGGLRLHRRAETQALTSSRMEMEQITLDASASLSGVVYITEQLAGWSDMRNFLGEGFRDELIAVLTREYLHGTGVGESLGISNSGALITVAKEAAQPADTIVGANLVKMAARCWGYDRAVWIANHDTREQLVSAHLSGTNSDQFLYEAPRQEGQPPRLLGQPLYFSEEALTLGDKGDLMLVNWTQYLVGDREGPNVAESAFVRWLEDERCLKFWVRRVGNPWWKSELTPRNSATTLSPYVTLAERS